MDLGLKGRRALVTGASRGLGRAVALALRAEGATVAICARDDERVRRTAREIGALPFNQDLSQRGAGASLVARAVEAMGGVDILVANTGGPPAGSFARVDDDAWSASFGGIFMSTVSLVRACLPGMRERRWGRILVVTSVSAQEPLADLMISNALRPGVHGLVNALSREVAGDGVTVNAIMPGYTLTERLAQIGIDQEAVSRQVPAGRMGRPEEFAALAAFLASEPAGYICGQAIACDGGLLRSI